MGAVSFWTALDLLTKNDSNNNNHFVENWLDTFIKKTNIEKQKQQEEALKQQAADTVAAIKKKKQISKLLSSNDDTTTGFGGSETVNSVTTTVETTSPSSIINGSKKVKMRAIGTIMSRTKKKSNTLKTVSKLYAVATTTAATTSLFLNNDKCVKKSNKETKMLLQENYYLQKPNVIQVKSKKKRNNRRRKSYLLDEDLPMDYIGPQVECSFNFPRVSAQLEKLMGTNVVRLTDRKYMQELQSRIQEDYVETLQKRISQREHEEGERQKHLILNGSYSPETCPPRLIIVHSVALAREMERERNLIMEGKGEKCPHELEDHPVFIANQKTNEIIARRRKRLKTVRERNAEILIKKGAKWEKERLIYDELDRHKRSELREKKRAATEMIEEYTISNEARGMDLLRIKNRDYVECEMALKKFLDDERNKMLKRNKEPTLDPKSKDIGVIEAIKKRNKLQEKQLRINLKPSLEQGSSKRMGIKESKRPMPSPLCSTVCGKQPAQSVPTPYQKTDQEETITKILDFTDQQQTATSKPTDSDIDGSSPMLDLSKKEQADYCDYDESEVDSYIEVMTDDEHMQMLDNDVTQSINDGHMLNNEDFAKLHYEDPMICQLKKTDNVNRMYELADQIIGGTPASNEVASNSSKKK